MTPRPWILLFIWFLLFPATSQAASSRDGNPGQDYPTVQVFEIAGLPMRVPVRFLRPIELPPDGEVRIRNRPGDSVQIHALAPRMDPPPHDVWDRWKGGNGFAPYVMIQVKAILPGVTEGFQGDAMRNAMAAGTCAARRPGDACPHPLDVRGTLEALYTGRGHEFVFCNRDGSVPRPHCDVTRVLFDGVMIDATFDRRLLDFADPVWERIYDLACSWIGPPSGRTLTINRCRSPGVPRPR